jgi:hypothetical protein
VNSFAGFCEAAYISKFPKRRNPFVMRKRLRKPACEARTAKGKPRKQITNGFSELFANYAVFSAMYIEILSSNIKITTQRKNLKTISAHAESIDLIS